MKREIMKPNVRDRENIEKYVQFFIDKKYKANGMLGFKNRSKEIARIIKENDCDLLIIGSHGHKAFGDWIFRETIQSRKAYDIESLYL